MFMCLTLLEVTSPAAPLVSFLPAISHTDPGCFAHIPGDLHRLPQMTQGDTSSPGLVLVTDLEFWDTDPKFVSNRNCLHALGAHLVNEVDVYDVRKTWSKAVAGAWLSKINLDDIGMVVLGGFHPHDATSSVVQSLAHQLPNVHSIVALYASRDTPPQFQDRHMIHLQAWTADSHLGYVVRATRGHMRCWSRESMARGLEVDPSLVKISAFTTDPVHIQYGGTKISPSRSVQACLRSGKHVLFCAEGDCSLACSCLQSHCATSAPETAAMQRNRYFATGEILTYEEALIKWGDQYTARQIAGWFSDAWPTDMTRVQQPQVMQQPQMMQQPQEDDESGDSGVAENDGGSTVEPSPTKRRR